MRKITPAQAMPLIRHFTEATISATRGNRAGAISAIQGALDVLGLSELSVSENACAVAKRASA